VSLASQKDTYEQVLTMKEQQLTNLNTRLTKLQEDFQAMNEEKVMA
jgi:chromosome condensin MukBEF ATPase and DNA-binding subunit MukB